MAQKKSILQAFGSRECIISQDAKLDFSQPTSLVIHYLTPKAKINRAGWGQAPTQWEEHRCVKKSCNKYQWCHQELLGPWRRQPAGCFIFQECLIKKNKKKKESNQGCWWVFPCSPGVTAGIEYAMIAWVRCSLSISLWKVNPAKQYVTLRTKYMQVSYI